MQPTELVTLNMRELDRLKVIQAVVDRMLKPGQAAERLHLTVRQIERLVLRYKQTGAAGVGSAARGRPGNRKLDEVTACRALILIRDRYADFGPTLACEKLRECHGLTLSKETVRHLMTDAGLWVPRKQRPPKIHQPRNRRSCLGELIQIDGSNHRWFEDRAPACTLLVFISALRFGNEVDRRCDVCEGRRLYGRPASVRRLMLCASAVRRKSHAAFFGGRVSERRRGYPLLES
jgi:transposase